MNKLEYKPLIIVPKLISAYIKRYDFNLKNIIKWATIILLIYGLPYLFKYVTDPQINFVLFVLYCVIFYVIFFVLDISSKIRRNINKQLRARKQQNINTDIIWETSEQIEVAKTINDICIKQFNWKKDSIFLPNDPLSLIMFPPVRKNVLSAFREIENKFSLISSDKKDRLSYRMRSEKSTVKKLVMYVIEQHCNCGLKQVALNKEKI